MTTEIETQDKLIEARATGPACLRKEPMSPWARYPQSESWVEVEVRERPGGARYTRARRCDAWGTAFRKEAWHEVSIEGLLADVRMRDENLERARHAVFMSFRAWLATAETGLLCWQQRPSFDFLRFAKNWPEVRAQLVRETGRGIKAKESGDLYVVEVERVAYDDVPELCVAMGLA